MIVFDREDDARRVQQVLPKRAARFGLTLHPDKTRLVRFTPRGRGPKPGSFDFLGFTHFWGRSRKGNWVPKRRTSKVRLARAIRTIGVWMRLNRHMPVGEQDGALVVYAEDGGAGAGRVRTWFPGRTGRGG